MIYRNYEIHESTYGKYVAYNGHIYSFENIEQAKQFINYLKLGFTAEEAYENSKIF